MTPFMVVLSVLICQGFLPSTWAMDDASIVRSAKKDRDQMGVIISASGEIDGTGPQTSWIDSADMLEASGDTQDIPHPRETRELLAKRFSINDGWQEECSHTCTPQCCVKACAKVRKECMKKNSDVCHITQKCAKKSIKYGACALKLLAIQAEECGGSMTERRAVTDSSTRSTENQSVREVQVRENSLPHHAAENNRSALLLIRRQQAEKDEAAQASMDASLGGGVGKCSA
jgi:hypothetical protein